MRRLRSVKPYRDQQLAKFIETFDKFETAYANCQQPEVQSKHKLLLFERQSTCRMHNRNMLSQSGEKITSALQSPQRPRSTRSAHMTPMKGQSLDNIYISTASPSNTVTAARRFVSHSKGNKPFEQWGKDFLSMLSQLYKAKCLDLKVDCNKKQQRIFISRLEFTLTKRKFDCPENSFGVESAIVISKYICTHRSILILVLDKNCLGDEAVKILAGAVPHSSLIKLSLVSTNMSWSGAATILRSLYTCDTLTDINLASCQGLYRNKLGYEGTKQLRDILRKVQTLHCLDVSGSSITAEGWRAICQGLSKNKSLCSLSVGKNELKQDVFASMMPHLTQCALEKLDVSRNNIQDKGLISLSDIIDSSQNKQGNIAACLRFLDLSDNGITSIGFQYFCRHIIKNFTLEKLWLDKNSLSKGNRFRIFRLLLQSTKSLTFLSMRKVGLQQEDYLYLSEGMQQNTSLIQLDMSENYLEKTSIIQICMFLCVNKTLRTLHLSKCNISNQHISQLAQAVDRNKTLEKLYLQHNFIKDSGAKHLEQILIRNYQLTGVHLQKNMVSVQKQKDIRKSLDSNFLTSSLGEPNMLIYKLKQQDNIKRKAELIDTIRNLQRKFKQIYRKDLQYNILYYECAIEQAQRRYQQEKAKLQILESSNSFLTKS